MAQGDGPQWAPGMPQSTMFSVYGSSHVGIFGATIQKTDVEEILQIDCNKTDMYTKQRNYPTFLFYNPYEQSKTIHINVGEQKTDVYDMISHTFLQKKVQGNVTITLPADGAKVLVYVPTDKKISTWDGRLLADGIVIDYRYNLK
jgi:hypothetical protein